MAEADCLPGHTPLSTPTQHSTNGKQDEDKEKKSWLCLCLKGGSLPQSNFVTEAWVECRERIY